MASSSENDHALSRSVSPEVRDAAHDGGPGQAVMSGAVWWVQSGPGPPRRMMGVWGARGPGARVPGPGGGEAARVLGGVRRPLAGSVRLAAGPDPADVPAAPLIPGR